MRKTIWLLIAMLAFSTLAFSQDEKLSLSVDDIFHPQKRVPFSGFPTFGLRWSKDGKGFVERRSDTSGIKIIEVDARTGEEIVIYDGPEVANALTKIGERPEEAKEIAAEIVNLSEDNKSVLLKSAEDLYVYNALTKAAKRVTNDKIAELEADFSPDATKVSFVRGNNLYAVDIATGKEVQFTKDGTKNILNGYLAWVYEEELYGRGQNRGYWWSPDSSKITFLRTDDTNVPQFILADDVEINQKIENTNYPQAGDPNPFVTLHIADFASEKVIPIDTSKYDEADFLISNVDWSPDSKWVIYQGQNREQTFLDLNAVDQTGKNTKTLFQDKTQAWIASPGNPRWLKDGSFIWRSPRNGWDHLYHYDGDGKLIRQITKGDWEVRSYHGIDQKSGYIYFSGTKDSHIGSQVYRIKLDGTGLQRISEKDGTYLANFNPTFTHFVANWSDMNTPWQTTLHRADGKLEKVINENKVELLDKYNLVKPEMMKVKNRDGFEMEAYMIKPPNFDPGKKYPVLSFVYGGPHAPQVRNSWGGSRYLYHQMLAQKGYIIWVLDPRSASGKGEKETWTAYKQLGVTEQLDLEDGVTFLKKQSYVDPGRIGIWGWSYGGYMTLFAMTHSKSFKMGISVAPVTDYRLYDSIYTERYMLTPENNPNGYGKTDLNSKAKDLSGKLLLVHGIMDNNVHMQNATIFAYEMQQAGKQFEFMAYPTQRHGISNPWQHYHLYTMMENFIMKNL